MAAARDRKSAATEKTAAAHVVETATSNGTPGPETGDILIDIEFMKQLIAAVDASSIDTVIIARAGTRIRISKSPLPVPGAKSVQTDPPPAAAAAPAAPAPERPAEPESPNTNLIEVTSPMVGTFYRAPAPEAPPYVEVGSVVTRGQTLCILEAMKLMNELESEQDGIVREILVENADPVEYGQVLFRIEPLNPS